MRGFNLHAAIAADYEAYRAEIDADLDQMGGWDGMRALAVAEIVDPSDAVSIAEYEARDPYADYEAYATL